jgi:BON domain-containing protein
MRNGRAGLIRQQGERCCGLVRMPLPPPVESRARQRLLEDCPYAFYFKSITFQFEDGRLIVRGRVPTFYLKQMLQVLLKNLDGVKQIDNQVDVVSATGLSSEPRTEPLG